ncbi:MAG: sensor domain-containing diguanylate cyclase, partial [Chloroflexota bacterium]
TSHEYRRFVRPTAYAGLVFFVFLIVFYIAFHPEVFLGGDRFGIFLILYALAGIIYVYVLGFKLIPDEKYRQKVKWQHAGITGLGLGILVATAPDTLTILYDILLLLSTIAAVISFGRMPAFTIIGISTTFNVIKHFPAYGDVIYALEQISIPLLAGITVETMHRLQAIPREQINRLEIVNKFSRQITLSLDKEQVLALLNAAIQDALEADSYFVGFQEDDEIRLGLFYDDGEYFNNVHRKIQGTLAGWIIANQKELFLPDLRQGVDMEGIELVIIGKNKTSLSWIGVPMTTQHVKGVIALASYQPNAFDRSDIELLANLAQHAAQALDNTYHHAQVEEESRLDSLTRVYNHGYFLHLLRENADHALLNGAPLSLIMLDIDHFKQYNDTYGHLIGDEILTALCNTIRSYIKNTDIVGRWGGEEFVICLPNTTGAQARQVADRIRQTIAEFKINHENQKALPAPTISQGIAIFPQEADEIFKLIDLADQRLYIAKGRGRNQVEPDPSYWDQFPARSI